MLYEKLDDRKVRCFLCSHHCCIEESQRGFCRVRVNQEGKLYTLVYGTLVAANVDPIEKKPLYHFMPGTRTYSVATPGCNFRCGFCQNWQISQSTGVEDEVGADRNLTPEQVVREAQNASCPSISYTYTEPTIFFEFAHDTARLANKAGLKNIFVTNGYMTEQALQTIQPFLDAANVDLKSFRDSYYRDNCEAHLKPVLNTISAMHRMGIRIEITTLIIPRQNDSPGELGDIARFIADLDPGIPWHISRFFPMYRFQDQRPTPLVTLDKAREIGEQAGLKHIHTGNV
jgi:pyruvate formate lyase activating enzyme